MVGATVVACFWLLLQAKPWGVWAISENHKPQICLQSILMLYLDSSSSLHPILSLETVEASRKPMQLG